MSLLNEPLFELPGRNFEREADFQKAVTGLARLSGWFVYHTADSRRSVPGFPDLVLWHPHWKVVLFRELKTQKGTLSEVQRDTIHSLMAAGADAGVWRPSDWEIIEEVLTSGQG